MTVISEPSVTVLIESSTASVSSSSLETRIVLPPPKSDAVLDGSVFYLKLEESSGITAFDSSGNSNDFDIIDSGSDVSFLTTGNSFTTRKMRFANEGGYLQLQGAQAKMGTSDVGTIWALISNWANGSKIHVYKQWDLPSVGTNNNMQMAIDNLNNLEFFVRNGGAGGNQAIRNSNVSLPSSSDTPILIAIVKPTASSLSLYQSPNGFVASTASGDPDNRWFNNVPGSLEPFPTTEMRMLASTDNVTSNPTIDIWRMGYTDKILTEAELNNLFQAFVGTPPP